jgi:hypothetical protein
MTDKEIPVFTASQLKGILEKVEIEYPNLLAQTSVHCGELICGEISRKIKTFLENLGLRVSYMDGEYKGRGTEFSGGKYGTSHCWVEMQVKLRDQEQKLSKVIIDGAYAQFFPHELTTKKFRDRVRLMFFINDPVAEEWYRK